MGGKWQKFKLLPRLTPHVRHRAKYLDVPIAEGKEFVFTDNGKPVETPARTLKELVALMRVPRPRCLTDMRVGEISDGLQTCSTIIPSHRTCGKSSNDIDSATYAISIQRSQIPFRSAMNLLPTSCGNRRIAASIHHSTKVISMWHVPDEAYMGEWYPTE